MTRYTANEVQESIIFDSLINYLKIRQPFQDKGLFAADSYAAWQDEGFQNYPFYFIPDYEIDPKYEINEGVNKQRYEEWRADLIEPKERVAMLDLATALSLFLIEKYNLFDHLTEYNQLILNKLKKKARKDSNNKIINKQLLHFSSKSANGATIKVNLTSNDKEKLQELGLNPKFESGNPALERVNIDIPWLLQIMDYNREKERGNGDFWISTEYLGYLNNAYYNVYGSQGFCGLGCFYFNLLELINDVENLVKNDEKIYKELKDENGFGLDGFFDSTNINIETTMTTDTNLPSAALPAAAQAQAQAILSSSASHDFGHYFAEPLNQDNTISSHINQIDYEVITHQIYDLIKIDDEMNRSFNIDFSYFTSEIFEDYNFEDELEWLEHYIIIRNKDGWSRLDCFGIEKPHVTGNNIEAGNFFDYSVEVQICEEKDKAIRIVENIKNHKGIGIASAIYDDSIYLVIAIDTID